MSTTATPDTAETEAAGAFSLAPALGRGDALVGGDMGWEPGSVPAGLFSPGCADERDASAVTLDSHASDLQVELGPDANIYGIATDCDRNTSHNGDHGQDPGRDTDSDLSLSDSLDLKGDPSYRVERVDEPHAHESEEMRDAAKRGSARGSGRTGRGRR